MKDNNARLELNGKPLKFDLRFPYSPEYNPLFDGDIHSIEFERMVEIGYLNETPLYCAVYYDHSHDAECEGLFRVGRNGRLIKIPLQSYENFENFLQTTDYYTAKPLSQAYMRTVVSNGVGMAEIASLDRVSQQMQAQAQLQRRAVKGNANEFVGNKLCLVYDDKNGTIYNSDIAGFDEDKIVVLSGWEVRNGQGVDSVELVKHNLHSLPLDLQQAIEIGYRKFLADLKGKKEIGMENYVRSTNPYQNELLSSWIPSRYTDKNGNPHYVELYFSPCPIEQNKLFDESKRIKDGDNVKVNTQYGKPKCLDMYELFARGYAGEQTMMIGKKIITPTRSHNKR